MKTSASPEIVITGYGACTPLGTDWKTTVKNLRAGKTGYQPEGLNGRTTCFGRIEAISDTSSDPRYVQLAEEALDDLRTIVSFPDSEPLGLVATSSKGELGQPDADPVSGTGNPGVWSAKLAEEIPGTQHIATPNTACATGLSALIHAARWLEDGLVEQALVVASESCFHPLLLAGYQNLKVFCDENGMRPFHPERSGFALGEGAAALHLTTESFRNRHGLERKGQLTGWGETCDAHHMTQMKTDGSEVSRAIAAGLSMAETAPEAVDLLHAHLTTTDTNDTMEAKLLENWTDRPILQAIKPSLGHTIGAAGLLEVIATLEVLAGGEPFPLPTTNRKYLPNPDHHPDGTDPEELDVGLTWNMGFGGHNAAAVLHSNNSNE